MEDSVLIELYWIRSTEAIPKTEEKYGNYCRKISENILHNKEDAEECVNDTYLSAWNSMPPQRPKILSAFLGKIVRNLSFNRYKYLHREKRGGGELPLILDELSELVSGNESVEEKLMEKELLAEINRFLWDLSKDKRSLFLRRYWYAEGIETLAYAFCMSKGSVTMALSRIRKNLKIHLEERGFEL